MSYADCVTHVGNTGSIECGFQCSIILYRFMLAEPAWKDIATVNHFSTIPQGSSQPICHRDEIIVGYASSAHA